MPKALENKMIPSAVAIARAIALIYGENKSESEESEATTYTDDGLDRLANAIIISGHIKYDDNTQKFLDNSEEYDNALKSLIDTIKAAEVILTPLLQEKALELYPQDDMAAALTFSDFMYFLYGDTDTTLADRYGISTIEVIEAINARLNNHNANEDDNNDSDTTPKCSSTNEPPFDPDAPLDVKAFNVSLALFGLYETCSDMPDEMQSAIDTTKKAYEIATNDVLSAFQNTIKNSMIHMNVAWDYYLDIASLTVYTMAMLNLINPDNDVALF